MLTLSSSVRVVLATELEDMRKSIDGLTAVVPKGWGEGVYSGYLVVVLCSHLLHGGLRGVNLPGSPCWR